MNLKNIIAKHSILKFYIPVHAVLFCFFLFNSGLQYLTDDDFVHKHIVSHTDLSILKPLFSHYPIGNLIFKVLNHVTDDAYDACFFGISFLNFYFFCSLILKISDNLIRLLGLLLCEVFFFEIVVIHTYSAFALITGFFGTYFIFRFFNKENRSNWIKLPLLVIYLVTGIAARFEFALFGAVLSIFPIITMKGLKWRRGAIACGIIYFICFLRTEQILTSRGDFVVEREKYLTSMFEGQRGTFLMPENKKDSLKIEALVRGYISDSAIFNIPFFKRITSPARLYELLLRPDWQKASQNLKDFKPILSQSSTCIFIAIVFLLLTGIRIRRKELLATVLFGICCAGVFVVSVIIKPVPHLIIPSLLVLLFSYLILWDGNIVLSKLYRRLFYCSCLLVMLGFWIPDYYSRHAGLQKHSAVYDELKKAVAGYDQIVVEPQLMIFVMPGPFIPTLKQEVLLSDALYIRVEEQMKPSCKSREEFYRNLFSSDRIAFVAEENFPKFFTRFSKEFYNLDVMFSPVTNLCLDGGMVPQNGYQLNMNNRINIFHISLR